ncbi:MAG: formylglycine-generating enzyme family protein [Dysgonamonadaceae bacterium]|jgi:formylglycine-generating enzyme required for sulfatase activity|nr:formylglycine-generating enzyme family protein [Dysgonamonadaceae bacterium]
MRKRRFITFGLVLLSSIGLLSTAESAVIEVSNVVKLFEALDPATVKSGDEIKVSVGKYFLDAELAIPAGVTVIGGFKDGFADENRIYPGSATEIAQMTVFDGNSVVLTKPSDKHRVATVAGILDGVLVRNGHVRNGHGGGVYIASTGTVQNCIIKGNVAMCVPSGGGKITPDNAAQGGGVYIAGGNLYNCVVVYNMSNQGHGVAGTVGKMINNTITANTSAPVPILIEGGIFHHYRSHGYPDFDPGELTMSTFYLAQTEVTTSQYAIFANAVDLSHEDENVTFAPGYLLGAGLKKNGAPSDDIPDLVDPGPACQGSVDKVPAGSTVGVRYNFTSDKVLFEIQNDPFYPNGLRKVGSDYVYNKSFISGDVNLHLNNESMNFVTWTGSLAFSLWIGGSLPTEAQWEFAARRTTDGTGAAACNTYMYAGSNDLDAIAWCEDNGDPREAIHEVATKAPNAIGLYDMNGNVWEWCADWYNGSSNYPAYGGSNSSIDPVWNTAASASPRIIRGGGWYDSYWSLATRFGYSPTTMFNHLGFRPVLVP